VVLPAKRRKEKRPNKRLIFVVFPQRKKEAQEKEIGGERRGENGKRSFHKFKKKGLLKEK